MFKLPYDTTAGSGYAGALKEIATALQHAAIDGTLLTARTGKDIPIEGLFEVPPYLKSVGQFAHPLTFERGGKTCVAVDTRAFLRMTPDQKVVATSPSDRDFAVLRGRLTKAWLEGRFGDMTALGDLAPTVFYSHVAEGIVRRLGLSAAEQRPLAILACYFYFGQFEQDREITEREILRFVPRIARLTANPADYVLSVLDTLAVEKDEGPKTYPVLQDLDQFVDACKRVSPNPRLHTLNTGLLLSAIAGGWYGPAARETVAIGLEYPPTWIALIYTALQDRTFNGALFTKLVQRVDKRDMGKQFAHNVASLLEIASHV